MNIGEKSAGGARHSGAGSDADVIDVTGLRRAYGGGRTRPDRNARGRDEQGRSEPGGRARPGGRPGFEAVRGIDFSVARGELFALLGTNGAGKTSTLELLEGLAAPTAG